MSFIGCGGSSGDPQEPNQAPTATPQTITMNKNTTKAITLTGTDPDGDALTYTVTTPPTHGTFENGVYTPTENYQGNDSFSFTADDGSLTSEPATVSIKIIKIQDTAKNQAPTAKNQSVTTNEDTSKAITISATDPDGDALTYTITQQPSHGTLSGTAPNLTYTPNANYHGSDSFKFKVNDSKADSNEATVSITINSVNDLPTANAGEDKNVEVNKEVTLNGSGTDSDGNIVKYEWKESGNTLSSQKDFDYKPTTVGDHTLTLTVTDNDGATASDSVKVTATEAPDNTPPVITLKGNETVTITVGDNYNDAGATATDDKDGDITNKIAKTGNVDTNTAGTYTITYKVKDKAGNEATATRTVIANKAIASKKAVAQLGNLAGAEVNIYKINDNGSKTLLWSENTSNGTTLDNIGNFNAHSEELDDNSYYLYEVKGGEDWDSNNDGIKDSNSTTNSGKIRAIIKGDKLKALSDSFRVTAISEILYEKIAKALKYNFDKNSFEDILKSKAKTIISNGTLDDIYSFNPIDDKDSLTDNYKQDFQTIIDTIHNGKYPLNISAIVGSYDTDGFPYGVTLSSDGTKAYVADYNNGLVIVDISDPINPKKLGSYDTDGHAYKVTLSSDGSKAYVVDTDKGFVIIDVSDPANPTKLGSYVTDNYNYTYEVTLSSDGSKAYVADGGKGLVVIDVSDPTNPTKLGSYDADGYAEDVTLSNDGTKAYVGEHEDDLMAIDVSDPTNPKKLGSYDTDGHAYGVTLSSDGTKAYVADGSKGLVVIDLELFD